MNIEGFGLEFQRRSVGQDHRDQNFGNLRPIGQSLLRCDIPPDLSQITNVLRLAFPVVPPAGNQRQTVDTAVNVISMADGVGFDPYIGAVRRDTIRQAAIDIGHFVGFIPSRRRPLSGTERIGKGMKYMLQATAMYRAIKGQGYLRV